MIDDEAPKEFFVSYPGSQSYFNLAERKGYASFPISTHGSAIFR